MKQKLMQLIKAQAILGNVNLKWIWIAIVFAVCQKDPILLRHINFIFFLIYNTKCFLKRKTVKFCMNRTNSKCCNVSLVLYPFRISVKFVRACMKIQATHMSYFVWRFSVHTSRMQGKAKNATCHLIFVFVRILSHIFVLFDVYFVLCSEHISIVSMCINE